MTVDRMKYERFLSHVVYWAIDNLPMIVRAGQIAEAKGWSDQQFWGDIMSSPTARLVELVEADIAAAIDMHIRTVEAAFSEVNIGGEGNG